MNTWDELISNRTIRLVAVAALGMLALFLLVLTINGAQNLGRPDSPAMNLITVTGEGKASALPTVANITFTITESASTVAAAQTAATAKNDAAIAAVKNLGVDEKDIRTLWYNVSPRYQYPTPCYGGTCPAYTESAPKITGYDVSQSIDVKVRDTDKAGEVLQALGTLGVQNISGPNFVVDNDQAVMDEARAEAIADAKARAKLLAKELGVRLGDVVGYYENSGYPMPYYAGYGGGGGEIDKMAQAPSLPPGQNETTMNVSITYEIR